MAMLRHHRLAEYVRNDHLSGRREFRSILPHTNSSRNAARLLKAEDCEAVDSKGVG
jgi:hypothetical protein